jgi:hypothetical protein
MKNEIWCRQVRLGLAVGVDLLLTVPSLISVAAERPPPIALTRGHEQHSEPPAVASGPSGYAVAWQQRRQVNGRDVVVQVGITLVGDNLVVVSAPRLVLDVPSAIAELHMLWTGNSYTLLVCLPDLNKGRPALLWGEIDGSGAFRQRGRYALRERAYQFSCGRPWASDDRVLVDVSKDDHGGVDADVLDGTECFTRTLALDDQARPVGRDRRLCEVLAHSGRLALGLDYRDETRVVDEGGRKKTLKAIGRCVTPVPGGFAAIHDGRVVHLSPQFEVRSVDTTDVSLCASGDVLLTVRPDRLAAIVERGGAAEVSFLSLDGKVVASEKVALKGPGGDVAGHFFTCAPKGPALACAYVAGDEKYAHSNVYFVTIPAP